MRLSDSIRDRRESKICEVKGIFHYPSASSAPPRSLPVVCQESLSPPCPLRQWEPSCAALRSTVYIARLLPTSRLKNVLPWVQRATKVGRTCCICYFHHLSSIFTFLFYTGTDSRKLCPGHEPQSSLGAKTLYPRNNWMRPSSDCSCECAACLLWTAGASTVLATSCDFMTSRRVETCRDTGSHKYATCSDCSTCSSMSFQVSSVTLKRIWKLEGATTVTHEYHYLPSLNTHKRATRAEPSLC